MPAAIGNAATGRLRSIDELGLDARVGQAYPLAGQHQCEVWLSRNGRAGQRESIMGVMMLAPKGSRVMIGPAARTRKKR